MDTNVVVVSGNLTRDPKLTVTDSKTKIMNFGIAVNESYYNSNTKKYDSIPSYFEIVLWGNACDYWVKRIKVGDKVLVSGKLKQKRYKDQKTGENKSYVQITALNIEEFNYLSKNGSSGASASRAGYAQDVPDYGDEDMPPEEYNAASYYNDRSGGFIG